MEFYILFILLQVHAQLQHFGVGAVSETFSYLKMIIKNKSKVVSSEMSVPFILSQNLPITVPISFIINDFRGQSLIA